MIEVILGRRGSGKSVLALDRLRRWCRTVKGPAVVLDTLMEYEDLPLVDVSEVGLWALETDRNTQRRAGFVGRVNVKDEEKLPELLSELREAQRAVMRPALLMVDEASYWMKPTRSAPALAHLIRYGRHWSVDLIAVGRRPAELSRELTAQADRLFVFRMSEPIDLDWLNRMAPVGVSETVRNLERYHYVEVGSTGATQDDWTIRKPVSIPA